MKISVTYNNRTYGNSRASDASEINISGGDKNINISINFKVPQPGRSWDWASSATVGSAEIDIDYEDAKALMNTLQAYITAHEKNDRQGLTKATLRLKKGQPAEQEIQSLTQKEWYNLIRKWLND